MAPINTKILKRNNKYGEHKKSKEKKMLQSLHKKDLLVESSVENKSTIPDNISTISIGIPASIVENAQSLELRTYLVGQIARAACIFQVDEIIVFDDSTSKKNIQNGIDTHITSKASAQLVRLLQYLECPQYLRKHLFPIHHDLKFAGILNPLEAPHHLRVDNKFPFREGIVTNKPVKLGKGSKVNIGLLQDCEIDKQLTPGFRCTVQLENISNKKIKGKVVSPSVPRKETGVYWGYSVRTANSFSDIFSKSIFKEGYDLIIGTSDRGESIDTFQSLQFDHLLIVFGGLEGLESVVESDEKLSVNDPKLLFDHYLNTLPNQGSRTIRTEEAVLISLAALRPKLNPKNKPIQFNQHQLIANSVML